MKTNRKKKRLAPSLSLLDKTKYMLCRQFVIYRRKRKMSERDLAKKLGITEERLSDIVQCRLNKLTAEKLVVLLSVLKPNLKLRVKYNDTSKA